VKLVGKTVAEKPGEVFGINCEPFETRIKSAGATCTVRRFSSHVGAYAVSFATDSDAKIDVSIDAKNSQVRQAGISGASEPSTLILNIVSGLLFAIVVFGMKWLFARSRFVEENESQRFYGGEMRAETVIAESKPSQPKLQIDYEGTEANKIDVSYKTGETEVAEIYIRARVRNTGLQTAKGARVFLTSLREVQASGTTPTSFYDSMPLAWSGWEFEPRDIPQGVCFYVDLMRASKHTAGWLLSVQKVFASNASLKTYSGTYRFQLTVTADNAASVTCEVDVTYMQDWHTLRAVAVPNR
jgi:hypothetical protein